MTRIVWSDVAEAFLLAAPPSEAERIVAAVETWSTTHRGFVRQMLDGSGTLGLYLPGFRVLFVREEDGGIRVDSVRRRPDR
jgi:hypothetical protein